MEYKLPQRFDDRVSEAIAEISGLDQEPDLILDFSCVESACPFGTLLVASALKDLIDRRTGRGLTTHADGFIGEAGAVGYLMSIGFFRWIGIPVDYDPTRIPPDAHCVPMTLLTQQWLAEIAGKEPFLKGIDRTADHLAVVLFPASEDREAAMTVEFCFREIVWNAFEHAQVDRCVLMAQRWPNGSVEIAIADRGIGIQQSLRKNYKVESPEGAIQIALLPGVTGKDVPEADEDLDRQGFGLYLVSELGRKYGEFSIASSRTLYEVSGEAKQFRELSLDGTIVGLKMDTSDIRSQGRDAAE